MFDHRYIFAGAVVNQNGDILEGEYRDRVYAKTKDSARLKLIDRIRRVKKIAPTATLRLEGSLELELI